jgi:hypothetical protein
MRQGTPYFEETQWLRDTRWIWFAISGSALASIIPLLYALISQSLHGEPVGDKPMGNLQIAITLSGLSAMTIVVVIVIRMIKFIVIVDQEGVHYNFFPASRGWKLLRKDQIVHYALLEKSNFFERIGKGYSKNRLTKTLKMRLQGRQIVRFELDTRWKIVIGTQRPDDFLKALQRMQNPDLTII